MSRLLVILLFAVWLCTACSLTKALPTPTLIPQPTLTPIPTAIPLTPSPQPSPEPTAAQITLDYKIVYRQGGFAIREAFLGKGAIWHWDDFPMPPGRIENTIHSLGLGHDMTCDKQSTSNTPCAQTLDLPLSNGGSDEYILRLADMKGGSGLLMKNGKLIWTGVMNGANSFAILSSKRVGDEIAFDYLKSNWGNADGPLWITASILVTQEKTITLIPDAFAPNAIDGKLIYFKMKSKQEVLFFDGKEVGETYNDVFNLRCCWHGPSLAIAANEKMIDFFAEKNDGWYHVQAGYWSGE